MCGIIGIASTHAVSERGWIANGRDAMSHRGPDGAGEWWAEDGRVGFGHRRLAIIDLSPAGHQPMEDVSGKLFVVFNGEIYNVPELRRHLTEKGHRFRSQTDTEVILACYREWGTDCLSRLNGMFAFAIYDSIKGNVFLARDRAGEKPLFYSVAGGTLRFASELKGLLADPTLARRIDPAALDCYFAFGFVPGARCMVRGVHKLQPAEALVFELASGEVRQWRYWNLPDAARASVSTSNDDIVLIAELETLLADAVRRQLVADVPVGVFLSGGVDSSLVTAMAARASGKVKTFTVRFPGNSALDETEHARLVARHFATEHIELDAAELTVDLLPVLARQFDEPMADSSMIPTYYLSRLVRKHCAVALGGDGGDELFGGYSHYSRLLWLQRNLGWIPLAVRRPAAHIAESVLPIGFKGRNWLQGLATDLHRDVPIIAACFDAGARKRVLRRGEFLAFNPENDRQRQVPNKGDLLQRATRMDFKQYLAEDILVKVDRASMLNSLEVRAPLLDYRVIEFAFGHVPSHLKATASSRKILLKKLAARLLPPEFDSQRKQGFVVPLGRWLQAGPWRQFFQETLLNSDNGLFNRKEIGNLLEAQANGRANAERLFALVLFELWRREYRMSL